LRLLDADKWLQPLAKEFGSPEVWRASIDSLGYPPTWSLTAIELLKLKQFLSRT